MTRGASTDSEITLSHVRGPPRKPSVYFLGGYHPVNESFIRSPPENVNLTSRVPTEAFESFERAGEFDPSWKPTKRLADSAFRALRQPRIVPVLGKYDLVHTNGSIIPLTFSPWIGSVENPSAFYGFNEQWHESPVLRRRLAKHLISPRCRAILPYTEASSKYVKMCLSQWESELTEKIQVLYPAIDRYLVFDKAADRPKARDETRFLFVGNHFFDKGGREVLKAFSHVGEAGNCSLSIVSSAPDHQKKAFEELLPSIQRQPGVEFFRSGLPRARLMDLFRSSDVFVFPSYMDQVPFVLLEAMAAGLPIIGSECFGIPEMAVDGVNGLLVKCPITAFPLNKPRTTEHLAFYRKAVMDEGNFTGVVEELTDKMSLLLHNVELRNRLAMESLRMVTSGRFSTLQRNKQLGAVYESSVRSEPAK